MHHHEAGDRDEQSLGDGAEQETRGGFPSSDAFDAPFHFCTSAVLFSLFI